MSNKGGPANSATTGRLTTPRAEADTEYQQVMSLQPHEAARWLAKNLIRTDVARGYSEAEIGRGHQGYGGAVGSVRVGMKRHIEVSRIGAPDYPVWQERGYKPGYDHKESFTLHSIYKELRQELGMEPAKPARTPKAATPKSAAPKAAKTPKTSTKATTPKTPASKLAQLQTAEQRARLGTPEQQAAKRALLDYVTTPARMKPLNEADQAYLRAVNAEIDARKANTQRGYGPSPAVRDAVAAKEAAHSALLKASNDFHEKYGVTALEAMAHAGQKRSAAKSTTRAKRAAKKAQA